MHARMHARTHARTHTFMHACMHALAHACTHTCCADGQATPDFSLRFLDETFAAENRVIGEIQALLEQSVARICKRACT